MEATPVGDDDAFWIAECARKAAKKFARNGRLVGMTLLDILDECSGSTLSSREEDDDETRSRSPVGCRSGSGAVVIKGCGTFGYNRAKNRG